LFALIKTLGLLGVQIVSGHRIMNIWRYQRCNQKP